MNEKHTIILTGAGAVIPWGAPLTADLTKILLSDNTFKSYTGQLLGAWIHHKLIGLYHKDPETVNFETIINSLEYLVTFFSSKEQASVAEYKNLMPAFFAKKDELWEILWFDRIYENNNLSWHSHGSQDTFHYYWKTNDDFFVCVFRHFINLIIKRIEAYSKTIHEKTDLNNSLNEFLSSLKKPLRCYTTNYDRIIPAVYNGQIFEGFTTNGKFDLKKVLTDNTSNIYYNMHGSVHYCLDFPNNVKYFPDKFIYNFGRGASSQVDQDKRILLNSNIISGFNKSSKVLTDPYLQFYLRFFQDCLFADKIFIIGYSFGDIHINKAIRTAVLANRDLKIICVDRIILCNEDVNMETGDDWVTLEGNGRNFLSNEFKQNIFKIIANGTDFNRISIYRKGFEQYLKRRQWDNRLEEINNN